MVLSSKVPVIILFTDRTSLHFHSRSYIISMSWICPSLTGGLFDGCTGSLLIPPPPLHHIIVSCYLYVKLGLLTESLSTQCNITNKSKTPSKLLTVLGVI